MKPKMNKKIYLGLYIASLTLALLGVALIIAFQVTQEFLYRPIRRDFPNLETAVLVLAALGGVQLLVVYVVYTFVLLAKMWGSIQDGYARTTPGKAIGFLFIPIFSIYWIFNVWGGFPNDYNSFVERHQLSANRLSPALIHYVSPLCSAFRTFDRHNANPEYLSFIGDYSEGL